MNPIWTQKTWWRGGGDSPGLTDRRYYRYHFEDEWFRFVNFYKADFALNFVTEELNTKGDENGHRALLANPDFTVRGINVMEWARDCVTKGKADFKFEIDAGEPFSSRKKPPICFLYAKFTDRSIATMFKLTFGGK